MFSNSVIEYCKYLTYILDVNKFIDNTDHSYPKPPIVGIPIGTNCAPFPVGLFVCLFVESFINGLLKGKTFIVDIYKQWVLRWSRW